MSFSERYGYKPVREIIQIDSINEELRNALWNSLHIHFWSKVRADSYGSYKLRNPNVANVFDNLWVYFFKEPLDTLEDNWVEAYGYVRRFFFACEWFEIYDFLEFVVAVFPRTDADRFVGMCNYHLQQENSAYRFVDGIIGRITNEEEIAAIESALERAPNPVQIHLHRALELQSDKKNPDYRNSIKESISAVESLVITILGEKGTLGELIKKLDLHPALQKGFSSIYGYTSDADGIRHAILESSNVRGDDARFFLIICSAFINLVQSRAK